MLAFFRRVLSSWVVGAILAVVMLAFIITGIGTPGGLGDLVGGGVSGGDDRVATVGGKPLLATDVVQRAQTELQQARQNQPDLTMAGLLAGLGGVPAITDQMISGKVLEVWGHHHGITASDRLVDGEIASIPAFLGPTGQFDQRQMQGVLARQHLTEATLRDGIRGDLIRRQLLVPISAGAGSSTLMAQQYAGVLTARRVGEVGLVPLDVAGVKAPTPAELSAYYQAHVARYSLPERRIVRYAPITAASVTVPAPTDAEIAAQYKADAAKYQASETRTLSQVVLPDEAAARALAARVAGGTSFPAAAAAAGFQAADIALGEQTKQAFAGATNPAIADQVFAARSGATVGPVKDVLGWHVVHVDGVKSTAARSPAQAHDELVAAVTQRKQADALAALADRIDDALGNGAGFDELVRNDHLTVVTTPPLLPSGQAPSDPGFKPDPLLTGLLRAAFRMEAGDQPTLETGPNKQVALLSIGKVVPAAPTPLSQIGARVAGDMVAERAAAKAQATAKAIQAKVDGGATLASALAAAGLSAPSPANASQVDLMRLAQVPPPLRALFTLAPGRSAIAQGPQGWFVVTLARIDPGAAPLTAPIAGQMKAELGRTIGSEYLEQFAAAVRGDVTVKRSPAGIAAVQKQLLGSAGASDQ